MSEQIAKKLFWLAIFIVSMALVFVLSPVLTPFVIAAFTAYLGDPIADKLEAKGCSRTWAVIIIFVLLTLGLLLGVLLLLPMIAAQLDLLVNVVPKFIDWLNLHLLPWLQSTFDIEESSQILDKLKLSLNDNWQQAGDIAGAIIAQLTRSSFAIAAWLGTMALIPVVAFYMLRDWDVFMGNIRDVLPRSQVELVVKLARDCDDVLSAFLRGQLLIMVLLGVIYAVGLSIAGLDLALLLGLLAGAASVVPYLGVIVGILAAGAASLVQFQDWIYLLPVLAVFGVGQLLESLFLTPVLVGDKIGLHPVAVIFAVLAGGQLFGFIGVLLALPVAAVIMVLLRHIQHSYKSSELYQDKRFDDGLASKSE